MVTGVPDTGNTILPADNEEFLPGLWPCAGIFLGSFSKPPVTGPHPEQVNMNKIFGVKAYLF